MQLTLSTPVDHPKLDDLKAENIRRFLAEYDNYANELKARGNQVGDSAKVETTRPVQLKLCVDVDVLESMVESDLFTGVTTSESLTDEILRKQLEKMSVVKKADLTLAQFTEMVEKILKMDMSDPSAESRMTNLFISYRTIVRKVGCKWVFKDRQKVAVDHVLSAIRPQPLQARLLDDLICSVRATREF